MGLYSNKREGSGCMETEFMDQMKNGVQEENVQIVGHHSNQWRSSGNMGCLGFFAQNIHWKIHFFPLTKSLSPHGVVGWGWLALSKFDDRFKMKNNFDSIYL